jgi:uncharacterized protein YndB with AHSA1/START domain
MTASDTAHKEFTISRIVNAPRDVVWKAWTDRDALAQWWGPKGCALEVTRLEVRPGGMFLYSMGMPNGEKWWGRFIYHEVVAPERIVFVNSFSDENGNIVRAPFSDKWPKEIRNVLTLTEEGGKTTVSLRGGPLDVTAEERAMFEGMFASMQQGFSGTFDQLDQYLARV